MTDSMYFSDSSFLKELVNNHSVEKFLINAEEEPALECNFLTEPAMGGVILTRIVKNSSDKPVSLAEIHTRFSNFTFGKSPLLDYFYANENARLYGQMTIPVDFNRTNPNDPENERYGLELDISLADPETICNRICSSPYQPFPAILVSNYETDNGLICGSISQDVFTHSFLLSHKGEGLELTVVSSFKDIAFRTLMPGEALYDRFYLGLSFKAQDINNIFGGYTEELRKLLRDGCGAGKVNRHTMIWDSWNDGVFRDVSEEMLLREARAVKRLFPNVEWFQLDDGYSAYCEKNVDLDAHGIGVPYEGESGVDRKKFPNGLRYYTDMIRKIGLRPAVWIGGLCPVKTKIYREHPEWFIDYGYRLDWTAPLDVSVSEARKYMKYALDTFVDDYGFEGIKHDFWSYAFEDRHDLLRGKEKSGYEYRNIWMKTIRDKIGDGYVQTGCDVSMGNPFIGRYFNNYRFGEDVASGIWERVLTTVFWGVAVLTTQTGDLFVPNSDSIGMLPGLSDRDFMFVVNFQIITRSLVEISGLFSDVDENDSRLKVVQRATAYLNNGENVYFPAFDYRQKGKVFPQIIMIKSAFDGSPLHRYTVGLFNPFETTKNIALRAEDLGLNVFDYTDVWSEETGKEQSVYYFSLEPHESKLLYVDFDEAMM